MQKLWSLSSDGASQATRLETLQEKGSLPRVGAPFSRDISSLPSNRRLLKAGTQCSLPDQGLPGAGPAHSIGPVGTSLSSWYVRLTPPFWVTGNKWYKQHLSYRLVNWPERLPEPAVRGAVRAAFQLWSNVSALEFWEAPATGPADIRLTFFQGDHNDGLANAFDGPGAATKPLSTQQEGHLARRGSPWGGSRVSILLETKAKPGSPPKDPPSTHL